MKVKIGSVFYDSHDQPIMLVLDSVEKYLLRSLKNASTRACFFPPGMDKNIVEEFMDMEDESYDSENSTNLL